MSDLLACYKLEKELRMQILSGFLPEYHRINSEKKLAQRYGICRNSVRKALANLEAEGLLFRKPCPYLQATPFSEYHTAS